VLLVTLLLILVGLVLGSFLSVVTWRIPRARKFVLGRSRCPKCGSVIAWYDNIPLVSYVVLAGKCRVCKKRISLRYPALEAVSALGFVAIYGILSSCGTYPICSWSKVLGFWGAFVFLSLILLVVIAVFVIDLENRLIPDPLVFIGLSVTFLALILGKGSSFYLSAFSAFFTALLLLLVNLFTKGKGMGLGDVKFALLGGAFFGWPMGLIWLFIAFLTGAGVAIILILLGFAKKKDKIAFGPFLAISFVITGVLGQQILNLLK
jgi:leader peptidase (prepilin peptidase)/N-methyltransferase